MIMIAELSVSLQGAHEVNEVRQPPVGAILMESLGNLVEDLGGAQVRESFVWM